MNRRRLSLSASDYVIYGLAIWGVLLNLFKNPLVILIPVLLIGGLIAYNRYLGSRGRSYRPTSPGRYTAGRYADAKKKSKTVPFRVIPGSKDTDDEPRYH